MRVMALFSTSFFAKYLRGGEDGPGRGHLCHTDTFLVLTRIINILTTKELIKLAMLYTTRPWAFAILLTSHGPAPSKNVSSNMHKMHRFRFSPQMHKISSGH